MPRQDTRQVLKCQAGVQCWCCSSSAFCCQPLPSSALSLARVRRAPYPATAGGALRLSLADSLSSQLFTDGRRFSIHFVVRLLVIYCSGVPSRTLACWATATGQPISLALRSIPTGCGTVLVSAPRRPVLRRRVWHALRRKTAPGFAHNAPMILN